MRPKPLVIAVSAVKGSNFQIKTVQTERRNILFEETPINLSTFGPDKTDLRIPKNPSLAQN
jgi:hypothetical protein